MAFYLISVNYVGDGIKGLIKEGGTARRAAAAKAIESVGGKMHAPCVPPCCSRRRRWTLP